MINYTYNFEVDDLMHLFVQAFDSVIIKRYNKFRGAESEIQVRYIFAPKQRVLHDIVNKQQDVTLPVVAITITNFERDKSRIFNKIYGIEMPDYLPNSPLTNQNSKLVRTPEPVNIGVKMSFLCSYQRDLNQLFTNFLPYSNPYIILSWQVPVAANLNNTYEVRSEVLWDGVITPDYKTEIDGTEKSLISADTNFTIKAWIYPFMGNNLINNIFYINTSITSVSAASDLTSGNYFNLQNQVITTLSNLSAFANTDTPSISGTPQFVGNFSSSVGGISAL